MIKMTDYYLKLKLGKDYMAIAKINSDYKLGIKEFDEENYWGLKLT